MVAQNKHPVASKKLLSTFVLILMLLLSICSILETVAATPPPKEAVIQLMSDGTLMTPIPPHPRDLYPLKGVIRIMSDGSVEGTDKISRNGNIYTLTGDLNGNVPDGSTFINIECDNIIFDGAGKTIRGTGGGVAIGAHGRHNLTIKNARIVDFGTGIELYSATIFDSNGYYSDFIVPSGNKVIDNYFETHYWAVSLRGVKEFVSGNTFNSKNGRAIEFWTNETTFIHNKFIDCGLIVSSNCVSNVVSDNTINGKPLVFLEGKSHQVVDGAAQVFLFNCKSMVVQNIVDNVGLNQPMQFIGITDTKVTNCKTSIVLINSNNNLLINNEFSKTGGTWQSAAVDLRGSCNNMITQNLIMGNACCGILCTNSEYNRIEHNIISSNDVGNMCSGVLLSRSSNNYVYENNINSEDYGIAFNIAEYNVVFNNNIYADTRSINMYCSLYNDVFGNNFSGASAYIVFLESSDFNNFYWNNFKGNTKVYEAHETYAMIFTNFTYYAEYNKWDNGNEGNFWSDYPDQDNGQGIGNTPYKVYEKFIDNYPLIEPYNTSTIQVTFTGWTDLSIPDYSNSQTSKNFQLISIVVIISVVTLLVGVTCLWRFKKSSKTKLAC